MTSVLAGRDKWYFRCNRGAYWCGGVGGRHTVSLDCSIVHCGGLFLDVRSHWMIPTTLKPIPWWQWPEACQLVFELRHKFHRLVSFAFFLQFLYSENRQKLEGPKVCLAGLLLYSTSFPKDTESANTPAMIPVTVTYCGGWGYYSKFWAIKSAIDAKFPGKCAIVGVATANTSG